MIHLRHINKSYGRHQVLHDLSLQLRKHEIHMLMGSNGAGKTTLARIIAGLEHPDSGIVEGTQNLRTMVMQQDFVIWPELTVSQNMSIADDQKQALHWLEKSGLIDVEKTKAGRLSHGQKQRLSIARAMAFQPQLLVIDEAFAYLDPARTAEAQTWIQEALADDANPLLSVLWISQSSQEVRALQMGPVYDGRRLDVLTVGEDLESTGAGVHLPHGYPLGQACAGGRRSACDGLRCQLWVDRSSAVDDISSAEAAAVGLLAHFGSREPPDGKALCAPRVIGTPDHLLSVGFGEDVSA